MATARGTLTLVCDNTPTTTVAAAPARNLVPVIDPVREAANYALAEPENCDAQDDAIETALQRMHNGHGTTPLGALMADVWRRAFVAGYRAAANEQRHRDLAEDADGIVTYIDKYRGGGDPA